MSLTSRGQHASARVVGALSRRTLGLEFDDLLALGCNVIRQLDPATAAIALTFDDGPSEHATPAILDLLDRHGARATFFMIGENAARHPGLVREVAARGHAIGSHGHQHLDCHWTPPWQIARDLRRCKNTLEDLVGAPIETFRAPFGHFRWDVKPIARRLGIRRLVGWNIAPAWNETSPAHIVDYVVARAASGSIVLLHDATGLTEADADGLNRAVVAALDPLLGALTQRGFGFTVV